MAHQGEERGVADEHPNGAACREATVERAATEQKRQEPHDGHDPQAAAQQAAAGGTAAVRVPRRIDGRAGRRVLHPRHRRQDHETGPAGAGDRRRGVRPSSPPTHRQGDRQDRHGRREDAACRTAPVQEQLAAGVARSTRKRRRTRAHRTTYPTRGTPKDVRPPRRARQQQADQRQAAPTVELKVEMEWHPASVGEGAQPGSELRPEQERREPQTHDVGDDQPQERVDRGHRRQRLARRTGLVAPEVRGSTTVFEGHLSRRRRLGPRLRRAPREPRA